MFKFRIIRDISKFQKDFIIKPPPIFVDEEIEGQEFNFRHFLSAKKDTAENEDVLKEAYEYFLDNIQLLIKSRPFDTRKLFLILLSHSDIMPIEVAIQRFSLELSQELEKFKNDVPKVISDDLIFTKLGNHFKRKLQEERKTSIDANTANPQKVTDSKVEQKLRAKESKTQSGKNINQHNGKTCEIPTVRKSCLTSESPNKPPKKIFCDSADDTSYSSQQNIGSVDAPLLEHNQTGKDNNVDPKESEGCSNNSLIPQKNSISLIKSQLQKMKEEEAKIISSRDLKRKIEPQVVYCQIPLATTFKLINRLPHSEMKINWEENEKEMYLGSIYCNTPNSDSEVVRSEN